MVQTKVLALGGCLLHGPMNVLLKAKQGIARPRLSTGAGTPGAYTFGEMLQLLSYLRGEIEIPAEIRPLIGMHLDFRPLPNAGRLDDVDVVLIEPNSPTEIVFEGFKLHRAAVMTAVTNPIKDAHAKGGDKDKARRAAKAAAAWVTKGIIGCDPDAQAEAADILASMIPADMPAADMARAVLHGARGMSLEPREGFLTLRSQIDRPIGLVTFMFQYMPDGRPISWPPQFHEQLMSIAAELGIPVFEPSRLVLQHGVEAAMLPDLRHYREEFIPVVASALGAFAADIHDVHRQQILPAA